MRRPRVFVSYTNRDGFISDGFLRCVESWLSGVCRPFVHRATTSRRRFEQFLVIWALIRSHVLIVLESPHVYDSPWVRLELFLARLKMMPVVKMPAKEFRELHARANRRRSA